MESETLPPNQTQRLLIVDDEIPVLKLVKSILSRAHYEVVTCETAEQALRTLRTEPVDCVITDAIMPAVSGYELIKLIRSDSECKDIPILMLTRKRDRQDVKKAVDLGVTDYVLKPIDEHLLLDKVELCLKKGFGKRHVLEFSLNGEQTAGEVVVGCKLSSISESFLTCQLSWPVPADLQCEINAPIFKEIGIHPPLVKLITCNLAPFQDSREPTYEAKFSFIGVPELDLRKIRMWLNREELRRRK